MADQTRGFPRGADLHKSLAIDQPGVKFQGQGDMSNYGRTPQGARPYSMRPQAHHQAFDAYVSTLR
jgi:hypothetical protein